MLTIDILSLYSLALIIVCISYKGGHKMAAVTSIWGGWKMYARVAVAVPKFDQSQQVAYH